MDKKELIEFDHHTWCSASRRVPQGGPGCSCKTIEQSLTAAPKIDHEIKKPQVFTERLQERLADGIKQILEEFPEVDGIGMALLYHPSLGDAVRPGALIYQRNPDDPVVRARMASSIAQLSVSQTRDVAVGFQQVIAELTDLEQELNARRKAAKDGARQGQASP